MGGFPSPCIDVCKYKFRGHCIACAMTKAQKSIYKGMKGKKEQLQFINMLQLQQRELGGRFRAWPPAYRRKCAKKGADCPID